MKRLVRERNSGTERLCSNQPWERPRKPAKSPYQPAGPEIAVQPPVQTTQIPPTWPKIPTESGFESLEKSDNKLNEQENKSENRTVEQQLPDVRKQRSKLYKRKKFVELKSKSKTTRKENSSQIKTGQKKNEIIVDAYLVGDSMLYNIEA